MVYAENCSLVGNVGNWHVTGSSLPVSAICLASEGVLRSTVSGSGHSVCHGFCSLPCLSLRSRNDSTITCTMPSAELTTAVRVCVQFENKSCASYNITFKYEKNPIISDINPKKSQIR